MKENKMIYKITVPRNRDDRINLLRELHNLGIKNIGEDHEFIFRFQFSIDMQREIATLAYKYCVNAGWIREESDE
jgi:hypothetical protein